MDVHHIVGGGEACTFFGTLEDWTVQKCHKTQDRVTDDLQGIRNPVYNMKSFETEEIRNRVEDWWKEQGGLPPKDRLYKGFRVRNLIRGSLARHLFRPLHPDPDVPGGEEDGTPEERAMAHRLSRAAALGIEIAEKALNDIRPDVVLLFNGYFYMEWIFSTVARRLGIRSVAHEIACFSNRMFFDPNGVIGNRHSMSSNMLRHAMDAEQLTLEEKNELSNFLADIYEGRVNNIPQARTEDLDGLRERLAIPRDKKIILQIGQVAYDTVMLYDYGTFSTSLDFLRAGIEAARSLPDCHLVMRLHPHEMVVNNNWTWREVQQWDLPSNVTVVHSRDANTYQLMEIADCGLAMTSQAGLEMAAFEKPVVVCGNAFYANKGFTYDLAHRGQLFDVINMALEEGGRLPEDRLAKLRTFLHYHIFRYLIPFNTENDSFTEEAVDRILDVLDPVGGKMFPALRESATSEPVNIVEDPEFESGTGAWLPAGSSIERISGTENGSDSTYVLRCMTDSGRWSGALYGCTKPNMCDERSLPCAGDTRLTISLRLKGVSDYEGVPVQVHVIGDQGRNYGTKKLTLTSDWQPLEVSIKTHPESSFLGVQVVKYDCPSAAAFLIGEFRVLPEISIKSRSSRASAIRNPESFPRLLIIDEVPFGNHTGYGVTVTNLFRGWPVDRLAQIYRMTDYEPDATVCRQQLSLYDSSRDPELKDCKGLHRFLLKSWKRHMGLLDVDMGGHRVNIRRALSWAKPFRPQAIFTSPVTYATAEFSLRMSRSLGIPYLCHIMDDWLALWESGNRSECNTRLEPLSRILRNRITDRLFVNAAARQVISPDMAEAYKHRYGYDFQVVHNAIDLRQWDLGPKDYSKVSKPFRILYTGAIWPNIQMPTLQKFAKVVAEMAEGGCPIRLEIYTHESFEKQFAREIASPPHVDFYGLVPYENMPRLMHDADALLVPVTFDEQRLLFSRYSMPTKVPEYMISGVPVILHGPVEASPVAYGIREKWGLVLESQDKNDVMSGLLDLMNNPALREQAGARARELAMANHDLDSVRANFWDQIKEVARRGA